MRKTSIKQLLKQSIVATGKSIISSETYDPLFQKYEKNLYKSHHIPKLKVHRG